MIETCNNVSIETYAYERSKDLVSQKENSLKVII